MNNLELLIGLVAIALAIFFGLWGFRRGIASDLSIIKDAVIAIRTTVEKTWDLVVLRSGESHGTVERELDKLGKVRITAEPGEKETAYTIEIEKPFFREAYISKISKESGFSAKETELFGKVITGHILSPKIIRLYVPSADPKICTEYITLFLKWLNSTYVESLKGIKEFEEPILP